MGAAASMKHVYHDAVDWFRLYFDKHSYKQDFDQINVNGDGVITFEMLQSWIHRKAKDGSFWQTIVSSESILRIAFSIASKPNPHNAEQQIVGIASFKQYLIHLFVLSVLWVHFKHADEWTAGEDLGMERLSLQKFKMACRTFSSAQAHEQLTDEMLAADFAMLDTDGSGTIEFAEVCKYCANFFHDDFSKQFQLKHTPAMMRKSLQIIPDEQDPAMKSLRHIRTVRQPSGINIAQHNAEAAVDPITGESVADVLHTASAKAHKAMDVIGERMEQNAKVATFEEIKISTEILLGITMS